MGISTGSSISMKSWAYIQTIYQHQTLSEREGVFFRRETCREWNGFVCLFWRVQSLVWKILFHLPPEKFRNWKRIFVRILDSVRVPRYARASHLSRTQSNHQISNERVLCLSAAVTHHYSPATTLRQLTSTQTISQWTSTFTSITCKTPSGQFASIITKNKEVQKQKWVQR